MQHTLIMALISHSLCPFIYGSFRPLTRSDCMQHTLIMALISDSLLCPLIYVSFKPLTRSDCVQHTLIMALISHKCWGEMLGACATRFSSQAACRYICMLYEHVCVYVCVRVCVSVCVYACVQFRTCVPTQKTQAQVYLVGLHMLECMQVRSKACSHLHDVQACLCESLLTHRTRLGWAIYLCVFTVTYIDVFIQCT